MRVLYNLDTGAVDDYGQVVIVDVPDDFDASGDYEIVEDYLSDNLDDCPTLSVVAFEDVRDSLVLLMRAHDVDEITSQKILSGLFDAVDNND